MTINIILTVPYQVSNLLQAIVVEIQEHLKSAKILALLKYVTNIFSQKGSKAFITNILRHWQVAAQHKLRRRPTRLVQR